MIQRTAFPMFFRTVEVQVKEDNGEIKSYHCLGDEKGYIYPKEIVQDLFEQVKDFYERYDNIELVDEGNKQQELEHYLSTIHGFGQIKKHENGKYLIPESKYKYKKFNPEKRDWSFKCHWCGDKVSSKTEPGYYTINDFYFGISMERACSEDCAKLIWKDGIKNWINENGYTKYFHI